MFAGIVPANTFMFNIRAMPYIISVAGAFFLAGGIVYSLYLIDESIELIISLIIYLHRIIPDTLIHITQFIK